jgi:hypothetical protein
VCATIAARHGQLGPAVAVEILRAEDGGLCQDHRLILREVVHAEDRLIASRGVEDSDCAVPVRGGILRKQSDGVLFVTVAVQIGPCARRFALLNLMQFSKKLGET